MIEIKEVINETHAAEGKGVLAVTGGGLGVFDLLMGSGGGSNTLLSGFIPYSTQDTCTFLGYTPEGFCSPEVAEGLCSRSFQKAMETLRDSDEDVVGFGLGVTASLAKNENERSGRVHQFFIHAQSSHGETITVRWTVKNTEIGGRLIHERESPIDVRRMEEDFLSQVICRVIYSLKAGGSLVFPGWMADYLEVDTYDISKVLGKDVHGWAFQGNMGTPLWVHCGLGGNSAYLSGGPHASALVPGSFNPMHVAHADMVQTLEDMVGQTVALELSMVNADKPPVSFKSLESRLESIKAMAHVKSHGYLVKLTHDALFINKIDAENLIFGVGFDTAIRFCSSKYADLSEVQRVMAQRSTRFVVFPRVDQEGSLRGMGSFPMWFRHGSVMVPKFRVDISSTEIRKGAK